ncbi:hypothetical protein CAPTEDRAFT_195774 [Capitella teleta]|uniref:Amino acid permease/ SLC12A domain-containing protein n=1 Tax=Capitella teleta TaxID=283909 RepID=R7TI12_CAPTE|nr:hypothetical protein CAPTEDRAFT_195774 [Capitella teleta]|eukprot:ELT93122.1 hypothetical protein CAPTEDRAFT_195774 [Capitella teleta]
MAVSVQVGIFIYIGWNDIFNVIEEVEKPKRNVPLGMFLSLLIVACLYLLTNVAYFTALSPEELLNVHMVVTSCADKTLEPECQYFDVSQSLLGALYISIGDLGQLIESLGIVCTLVFMTLSASVLYIRTGKTKFKSTIQMPIVIPIISTGLILGLYILGPYQNQTGNIAATGMLLLAVPVHYVFVYRLKKSRKSPWLVHWQLREW